MNLNLLKKRQNDFKLLGAVLIVAFGFICRLSQYLFNRSFWYDEAASALKISHYSLHDIFCYWKIPDFLMSNQPPYVFGFYVLEKISLHLFGNNELALRFIPFLASVVAVLLFYFLLEFFLDDIRAILWSLTLFASSQFLIYFSSELKPYGTDLLISIGLTFLICRIYTRPLTPKWIFLNILWGCVAVWFAYPSIFILGGGALSLGVFFIQKKDWEQFKGLSVISVFWLSSFLISYLSYTRHFQQGLVDISVTLGSFMPVWPIHQYGMQWYTFKWFYYKFVRMLRNPAGLILPHFGAFFFIAGCIHLFRSKKTLFGILIFPILLTLVASGFKKYLFFGRMLNFLAPTMIILLGAGIEAFVQKFPKRRLLSWTVMFLLLVHPVFYATSLIFQPKEVEEIKPVLAYVHDHWQEGDRVYVYWAAKNAFDYYFERYGFKEDQFVVGPYAYAQKVDTLKEFGPLRGGRVWIVFAHVYNQDEKEMTDALDHLGQKTDGFSAFGSRVYLYNLNPEISLATQAF